LLCEIADDERGTIIELYPVTVHVKPAERTVESVKVDLKRLFTIAGMKKVREAQKQMKKLINSDAMTKKATEMIRADAASQKAAETQTD
jgi:hypothetical protein